MQLEEEIALVEKIQKYDDGESLLILWEEYGNFVYKSLLKYIYYKNFNIPLESEDYLSSIFYAIKEAVIKCHINHSKSISSHNSFALRTTWLRSDLLH